MRGTQLGRGAFLLLLAVAVAAASSAVALVLAGEGRIAGLPLAVAAGALFATRFGVGVSPRLVLLEAVTERALEAAVLGAIAWVALPEEAPLAVGATVALGVSYLAAYFRSRSLGLGFRVRDPALLRGMSPLIVAGGLLADDLAFAMWAVVALSAIDLGRHIAELSGQREPR
jgi:hypothetical protein